MIKRRISMEEMTNIIELIDEENNSVSFEHIMTLEYEGQEYIVLEPLELQDDDEEGEVVILKVEQDENGDDIYVTIDDEEELEEVYDAFLQVINAEEE